MVTPAAGSIVLVPFPFSDLSSLKLRPTVVLAAAGRGDWILCQVTSNPYGDPHSVRLNDQHLSSGSLERTGYARPGKLFTASNDVMIVEVGRLHPPTLDQIIRELMQMLDPRPGLTVK